MSVIGTWSIVASDDFDDEYLSMEEEPYVVFRQDGDRVSGTYQWGVSSGDVDGRLQPDGSLIFTFEGTDELDPTSGAGTARAEGDRLTVTFMVHRGDDYTFECERSR